ncbi:nonribosomal peptide synthase [Stemphylium lycopersici]|uniref:Nonribosomal peptide synthase n=1 Tax=Stemphylium lycopersici TaxID=183478 RepID=A0A364MUC9_STELY|nr:nonribosomal peptide synthase [Stemphylium lycopersici]RAR03534.1 nonribosomal peptide synthase [Stemphylium lycopersici]
MVTHSNFASALRHQQPMYPEASRVYDFSSHSFDLLWLNFGATLTCGGCLCIPSDEERKDNIVASITRFKATAAGFTPTLARTFEHSSIPLVKTVLLGGEAVEKKDYDAWSPFVDLKNAYGPSECTPATTCLSLSWKPELLGAIGLALGMNAWIVDPEGYRLQPIGEVGELWLEGPCVGDGYLDDPDKTAAAFIKNPSWLQAGGPNTPGRQGRLYRTGDLVRHGNDGILFYMGRKDAQVKIRGQRVELGEVEHHVRALLLQHNCPANIVAEVIITPKTSNPRLVVFLAPTAPATTSIQVDMEDINTQLAAVLPSYMIPSEYITIEDIPLLSSGKTDRRRLQEMSASIAQTPICLNPERKTEPRTTAEKQLQALWATVLGLERSSIKAEDSFLRIGGDSIQAMRLVTFARKQGFELKVAEIFQYPTLDEQAKMLKANNNNRAAEKIVPFSLLSGGLKKEAIITRAASMVDVDPTRIQDIFPCTSLQEGMLAMTARRAGDYVSQAKYRLSPTTDEGTFRRACETLVRTTPILRTRIIDLPSEGLVQAVVDEPIKWTGSERDFPSVGLGTPLTSFCLVKDKKQSGTTFIWNIHHAIFDGWSIPLMLKTIENAYRKEEVPSTVPFQNFVEQIMRLEKPAVDAFWQSQLGDSVPAAFPQLTTPTYQPKGNRTFVHKIDQLAWPSSDITPTTCLRTAWAILQSHHTGSNDVVFGATVSGRQAAVSGIEEIVGPTIATVPVRVQLDWKQSVDQIQKSLQKQAIDMIPFEQTGLQRIRRISDFAKEACQFQTLLVIQPEKEHNPESQVFQCDDMDNGLDNISKTYALKLEFHLGKQGVEVCLNYDSSIIEENHAERLVYQLEHVLRQICSLSNGTRLRDIDVITPQDLKDICTWNRGLADPEEALVHDLFQEAVRRNPTAPAVHAWDGKLTYHQLDELSTRLACQLIAAGVRPNTAVPLGFEKSMWTPVSILAVMKAGGASVLLDMAQPEQRLSSIINQVKPRVILTSPLNNTLVQRLSSSVPVLIVDHQAIDLRSQDQSYQPALNSSEKGQQVKVGDLLYVVFTSGSTGTPKGVMISHYNFASGIKHQRSIMGIDAQSRTFDFSSYLFDISWTTHLHTLTAGGCLCIPSDYDRQNRLREAIQEYGATVVNVTPSVAHSLHIDTVSSLKRLILSGEKVTSSNIRALNGPCTTVVTYGTAECTVKATFVEANVDKTPLRTIGKGYGVNTWLVDPSDHMKLAPVGAVGEICIEGPLVGQGYFGDPEKTAQSFIYDPPWLVKGPPGTTDSGRRGVIYKTGDLARYTADGALLYMGRKDAQIKIRGQRVELGEVEYHVHKALPECRAEVVAEVLTPKGLKNSMLVAFIRPPLAASDGESELRANTAKMTQELDAKLECVLPPYMIPSVYIPIKEIPMGATGKLDRRKLRDHGNAISIDEINGFAASRMSTSRRKPERGVEAKLQELWAKVLGIEASTISADDNFFRLGGDSIAAMRLVRAAQDARPPNQALDQRHAEVEDPKPFSLFDTRNTPSEVLRTIAPSLDVSIDAVQDLYPLPSTQAHLVSLAMQDPPQGCVFSYVDLTNEISLKTLKKTVADVWKHFEILRSSHVQHEGGIWQIIHKNMHVPLDLYEVPSQDNIATFSESTLRKDLRSPMKLGEIYSKFAIFHGTGKPTRLSLRMSHAQYDGFSLQTIAEYIGHSINGRPLPNMSRYSGFVKYSLDNEKATHAYYKSLLQSSKPLLPMIDAQPTDSKCGDAHYTILHKTKSIPEPRNIDGVTPATVFIATSAYVLAKQRKTDDVILSLMVSGRSAMPTRMYSLFGALINLIPCRVQIKPGETLGEILPAVQNQRLNGINYEACTMVDTLETCVDWPQEQQLEYETFGQEYCDQFDNHLHWISDTRYIKVQSSAYLNFSNIRYASPPIGERRFAAPTEPDVNRTVQNGKREYICPQATTAWIKTAYESLRGQPLSDYHNFTVADIESIDVRTSEDCLFLDVLASKSAYDNRENATGATVLVWIHGGGFVSGSKTLFGTGREFISKSEEGGIVYVSINYRLGLFGWLSPQSEDQSHVPNAGLLDQRFALEWVQKYIHLFGGDPNRVTVMGESAGGGSIMYQMTAYGQAKAPFSKAIIQSPYLQYISPETAKDVYQQTLKRAKANGIGALKRMPSSDLQTANALVVGNALPYGTFTFGPVVDGSFVPSIATDLLAHGRFDRSIAVMTSHNSDEGRLFTEPSISDESDYRQWWTETMRGISNNIIDNITEIYPSNFQGSSGYTTQLGRAALTMGDYLINCNAYSLNSALGNSSYAYQFSVPDGLHGDDTASTFYEVDDGSTVNVTIATIMQRYFLNFAKSGTPNGDDVPLFPWYGRGDVQNLSITSLGPMQDTAASRRCAWWQQALYR